MQSYCSILYLQSAWSKQAEKGSHSAKIAALFFQDLNKIIRVQQGILKKKTTSDCGKTRSKSNKHDHELIKGAKKWYLHK